MGRWDKRLMDQASDVPSIIFSKFLAKFFAKIISTYFLSFYNSIKIKSFECPWSIRNYDKNNAWLIRCLVDESFVPLTQRARVLHRRLSDFNKFSRYRGSLDSTLQYVSMYLPNLHFRKGRPL